MIGRYVPAPSHAQLTMSWLARLGRARSAEKTRERGRVALWESEGGSLSQTGYERYRTDSATPGA